MKQIVIALTCLLVMLISKSHEKSVFDGEDWQFSIRTVEVIDSQLMDQILFVTESDSVLKMLHKHFYKGINFHKLGNLKPKIDIYIDKRHLYSRSSRDTIFEDLLTKELKDVVDTDTLIQVVLNLSELIIFDYETTYKGKHFFFDDIYKIDNKPIFKLTKKHRKFTENSKKYWIILVIIYSLHSYTTITGYI